MTAFPRTQEEIVARIKEAQERDVLGFEWQEYIDALDWNHLQQFLKPDHTLTEAIAGTPDADKVSDHAKGYVGFWLEKIEDERGISVQRATMHFRAWKWLLGHPDADTFPGADYLGKDDGGWYQRDAYEYIKAQIDSGDFDRMTAEAVGS